MNYNTTQTVEQVEVLTGTPADLEAKTGIKQATLSILLRLAEKSGDASIVGTAPKKDGKGKAANIWKVNSIISINLK